MKNIEPMNNHSIDNSAEHIAERLKDTRFLVYVPNAYQAAGSSYTPVAIAQEFHNFKIDTKVYFGVMLKPPPRELVSFAGIPLALPIKIGGRAAVLWMARKRVERRILTDLRRQGPGAVLWLWPDASPGFAARARQAGALVVREMINTHIRTMERIMSAEAAQLGLSFARFAPRDFALEDAELASADVVASPSAGVDQSVIEWGTPENRLLRTYFGWDPQRLAPRATSAPAIPVTALFMGTLCIRKGIHLALEAWRQADCPGRFLMVGHIEADVATLVQSYLEPGRIEHLPYTSDVASLYRQAGFLLFPTLEEGAPLVCYEAAGCGLPILTTAMGSARIVEHESTGLIVDAHDAEALVAAIRRLASEPGLRDRLSANAEAAAARHRWCDAAQSRIEGIARWLD